MAKQSTVLTDTESEIIRRVRMTPEQHAAEREARREARLAQLPPAAREASQAEADALAAMSPGERRAYAAGRRLAMAAESLQRAVDRLVTLPEIVSLLDPNDQDAIVWLKDQLAALEAGN